MSTLQWRIEHADEMKRYRREWYNRNKESECSKAIKRNKKNIQEKKEWFTEFKNTLKCEKCSEDFVYCLEFHHKNPHDKEYNVATMIYSGYSREKILEEVSKCIVLCANCHRKEHFNK